MCQSINSIVWTITARKKEENEPKERAEVCFVEEHDRYCTDMDQHIKQVLQQHHLDSMKKLAESDLKLISKDLLKN